jgi:malonate transporter
MFDILAITGPIYIAVALGYATTRFGLFSRADMRVFGKFVIQLALPAMLFNALSQRQIGDILNGTYLLAYLAGSLLILGVTFMASRKLAGLTPIQSTFYAMGVACSNSGFVGYPILLLTFAPVAAVALALNMVVENLVIIPVLLILAERAHGDNEGWVRMLLRALVRLAKNPMIIAMVLGFVASLLRWRLPVPLERSITMFALSSGALSLFVIGGTLFGLPFEGMLKRISLIVVGKLVFHPLLVLLALNALPALGLPVVEAPLKTAAVLMAAMPMMGIYPILAQAYGQEDFSAAALFAVTVVSFFTISGLLWLIKLFPL